MIHAARVSKDDYPRILALADVEGARTSDIAKLYGVVPRTICIILNKARNAGVQPRTASALPAELPVPREPLPVPVHEVEVLEAMVSLAEAPIREPEAHEAPELPEIRQATRAPEEIQAAVAIQTVVQPAIPAATVRPPAQEMAVEDESDIPVRSLAKGTHSKGNQGKRQGHTLIARTEDGEETLMPFGSLDDLLSSLRGVFREAARGEGTVWFGLRKSEVGDAEA